MKIFGSKPKNSIIRLLSATSSMKPQEKNFETLLDMIDASEVREDDETYMNPIDRLFEALEKKEPTHFAVKQYKKYKLAAGVIELRRTLHHYLSERCFA